MRHKIVTRHIEYPRTQGNGIVVSPYARGRIRQCANCGCSEHAIEYFGWDECQPTDDGRTEDE